MSQIHHVLLISGSTRKDSNNGKLLQIIPSLAPEGLQFSTYDRLADIPAYCEDTDNATPPPAVKTFRNAVTAASGIIIAAPEYNYSIPGPLKNAIDWASRPYGAASLTGKCMALFVATTGRSLGFNGLAELRRTAFNMVNFVVAGPQVVIQEANKKWVTQADGQLKLDDAMACHLIAAQLYGLHMALQQNAGQLMRAPWDYMARHKP